jgi:hypothetical protein
MRKRPPVATGKALGKPVGGKARQFLARRQRKGEPACAGRRRCGDLSLGRSEICPRPAPAPRPRPPRAAPPDVKKPRLCMGIPPRPLARAWRASKPTRRAAASRRPAGVVPRPASYSARARRCASNLKKLSGPQ